MRTAVVDASATTDLRRRVLRPGWSAGIAMHGDDDPAATHIAALDGAQVVGACVVLPAPYPLTPSRAGAWQLRGMATEPDRRGEGIGAAVLAAAVECARQRRGLLLWCQARDTAIAFYARHGFVAEGERFLHAETAIVHQLMYRELSGLPASSTR